MQSLRMSNSTQKTRIDPEETERLRREVEETRLRLNRKTTSLPLKLPRTKAV